MTTEHDNETDTIKMICGRAGDRFANMPGDRLHVVDEVRRCNGQTVARKEARALVEGGSAAWWAPEPVPGQVSGAPLETAATRTRPPAGKKK